MTDVGADLSFKAKTFTIKRGEQVALRAWFERRQVAAGRQPPEPVGKQTSAEQRPPSPVVKGTPVDDAWVKQVAKLPAEKQVAAVAAKLKEINPGFAGEIKHRVLGDKVDELSFSAEQVTNLSPVRALPELRVLRCGGRGVGKGQLADLSPLRGMKIEQLRCSNTRVSNLSPLKDLKLTHLHCDKTEVADLSPLKWTPLTFLQCNDTQVSDLSPLQDLPLTSLWCQNTQVTDLSPLKDLLLVNLSCDFNSERDTKILRSIKTLQTINAKPVAQFWKEVAAQPAFDAWLKQVANMPAKLQVEAVAAKLKELNPSFDGQVIAPVLSNTEVTSLQFSVEHVTDLSPVRALTELRTLDCRGRGKGPGRLADLAPLKGLKLTRLDCGNTQVRDLSPLRGMPLEFLRCDSTQVADLTPLQGMPLKNLTCDKTQVADLSPLKGMKLSFLRVDKTAVADLTPVKGMPLHSLYCSDTKVADLTAVQGMPLLLLTCERTHVADLSPLKGLPLKELVCDFRPSRDAEILRSLKTLERINGQPVAQFWKEVDQKKLEKSP